MHRKIKRKKEDMCKTFERNDGCGLSDCKKELNGLLQDEEVMWRQNLRPYG